VNEVYLDTARMLVQVAPVVFAGGDFALKGGTAINLFIRDMPRLSVDLDLVFVDHRVPREAALTRIGDAMRQAAQQLTALGFQVRMGGAADTEETKLLVRRGTIEVKVEVNLVMRGTVHLVRVASLTPNAREALLTDLEIPVVSVEDVYGGKLVAAMDRQHPRDLFDVMQLFAHEGITDAIRRAFVVYLACHSRPIHEVLFPTLRDIRYEYENNFQGMTAEPITLGQLLAARERMVDELQHGLDANERNFLISLARNRPECSLLGIEHLEELPAIRWKLHNLDRLERNDPKKFAEQADALTRNL